MSNESDKSVLQTMDSASNAASDYVQEYLSKPLEDSNGKDLLHDGDRNIVATYFENEITKQKTVVNSILANTNYDSNIDNIQSTLTKLIDEINTFTDLKCGTIRTRIKAEHGIAFVGNDKEDKSPIMLRDARLQSSYREKVAKPEDVAEQTIAAAAANIRGTLQIIKDSPEGDRDSAAQMVLNVFTHYAPSIRNATTQESRNDVVSKMNGKLVKILKSPSYALSTKDKHGNVKSLNTLSNSIILKGIGLVRDLTNLQNVDRHTSQITISSAINKGENYSVEALVPVNPISTTLKEHYTDAEKRNRWSESLHPLLRNSLLHSTDNFCSKITDGKHIISSQIKAPGLQNAYQHNIDIVDKDGKTITKKNGEKARTSVLRAAAPAHNEGKASSLINKIKRLGNKVAQRLERTITAQNINHLKAISGRDITNLILVQTADPREHIGQGLSAGMQSSGSGTYYNVEEAPISVSANKGQHLNNIPIIYDKALANNNTLVISCAKAKDRTAAAIMMLTSRELKENNPGTFDNDLRIVAQAQSGAAASAAPGATDGIFGTKASNVLKGLKAFGGRGNPLLIVKDLITSKLCNLNHPHSKKDPTWKLPIEQRDQALDQANTIRNKISNFFGRGPTSTIRANPTQGNRREL